MKGALVRLSRFQAIIGTDALVFRYYPFEPASVWPDATVPATDIEEVDLHSLPPTVMRQGELLFIPATESTALEAFAMRHGIPVRKNDDVWSLLLSPFLDTSISPALWHSTNQQLAELGLRGWQIALIRARVGFRVFMLNCILWEWVDLSLFDLLLAMMPLRTRWGYRRVYWWAMRIALQGRRPPEDGK